MKFGLLRFVLSKKYAIFFRNSLDFVRLLHLIHIEWRNGNCLRFIITKCGTVWKNWNINGNLKTDIAKINCLLHQFEFFVHIFLPYLTNFKHVMNTNRILTMWLLSTSSNSLGLTWNVLKMWLVVIRSFKICTSRRILKVFLQVFARFGILYYSFDFHLRFLRFSLIFQWKTHKIEIYLPFHSQNVVLFIE